jgi:hypothetical protein
MLRITTEIFVACCAALGFFVLLWLIGLFPQESGVAAVIAGLAAGGGYAVGRLRTARRTTEVLEP